MLCNEIGPLVSQVILSHRAKSHYFFDVHGGIYSVNVSSYQIKVYPTQLCAYIFLCAYVEFMHIFAFPSSIFYVIVQNLHKNGWIEIQFLFDHLLLIIIEVLKTFSQTLKDSVTTSLCKVY